MSRNLEESDAVYVARVQRGDEYAFSHILQRYYPVLRAYVIQMTGSSDVADDILQDVFVRVWHTRGSLDPAQSIKAYLYTAARRSVINTAAGEEARVRREELYVREFEDRSRTVDVIQELEAQERLQLLQLAVDTLPDRRREIFLLVREHGLSYPEVASVLGISTGTVKTQMARAIATLGSKLAPLLSAVPIVIALR